MVKMSFDDTATRYGAEPGGEALTKVKVTFVDSAGQARTVEGEVGSTVMETALRNGIPEIAAECGGACACATCHVYVDEEWREKAGKPSQMEEDMLDFAFEVQPTSRLSCQITVTPRTRRPRRDDPGPAGLNARRGGVRPLRFDVASRRRILLQTNARERRMCSSAGRLAAFRCSTPPLMSRAGSL